MSKVKTHQKIEIKTKGEPPSIFTEVLIDGHPIECIRELNYKIVAGKIPVLSLDISALNISIDSETAKINLENFGQVEKIVFEDGTTIDNDGRQKA